MTKSPSHTSLLFLIAGGVRPYLHSDSSWSHDVWDRSISIEVGNHLNVLSFELLPLLSGLLCRVQWTDGDADQGRGGGVGGGVGNDLWTGRVCRYDVPSLVCPNNKSLDCQLNYSLH